MNERFIGWEISLTIYSDERFIWMRDLSDLLSDVVRGCPMLSDVLNIRTGKKLDWDVKNKKELLMDF